MIAIRVCARCKTVFDAIVGEDGIYCSAECEHKAQVDRRQQYVETAIVPTAATDDGEYFDDFPPLTTEEFETAIARVCQRQRRKSWK